MALENLSAYARDRWEVKALLLDYGFKKAAQELDDMAPAIAEQIIGVCYSIQRYRDTTRFKKSPTLLQKIRTERNLDRGEFVKALQEFQGEDMLVRNREWRERLDQFAETRLEPAQVAFLKKIKGHFPQWIEEEFTRRNPKPQPIKIGAQDIAGIEDARPDRKERSGHFVELLERFCSHVCGVKLSWEELLSELGSRDPRAKKAEYQKRKAAQKEAAASEQAA